MARNGAGVYSAPAGTLATTQTPIESAKYNAFVNDLVTDANAARPVAAGGTGATTAAAAWATFSAAAPATGPGPVPAGCILMWSGAVGAIPAGWRLCDGTGGTPDLRGRFIVGAGGAYAVGANGGAETVTLTVDQMPGHSHFVNLNTNASGDHQHSGGGGLAGVFSQNAGGDQNAHLISTSTGFGGNHSHNVQGDTETRGAGQSHENRPPYYALCYIMKL